MRRLVTIAVLACLPAATAVVLVTRPDRAEPAPAVRPAAATPAAAGAIPLHFEENAGQAPSWARFVARGAGPPVLLGTSEAVVLADEPVRIRLRTQASPEVEGEGPLPARIDYYRGSDPAGWITGVRAYAGVGYHGVYPGVDLRYHALRGSLEHDFLVAPGADPAQIALELLGGRGVRIERGDLVVRTGLGGYACTRRSPTRISPPGGSRFRPASSSTAGRSASTSRGTTRESRSSSTPSSRTRPTSAAAPPT
jgi:hypothetical protein